jgi:hypothetical protein
VPDIRYVPAAVIVAVPPSIDTALESAVIVVPREISMALVLS